MTTIAQAASSRAAAHAIRLGLPRIDANNAATYPPVDLRLYRAADTRARDDCAPSLWYWQMTGKDWDREGKSYEHEKKRHKRLAAEDAQRLQEKQREQQRAQRDRSERKRPADDHIRRREQLAAQTQQTREEVLAKASRADAQRRDRRRLLAHLLTEAGLDNSFVKELNDGDGSCPSCGREQCIHLWISDECLEMEEAEWVEDLAVCCTRYRAWLDKHGDTFDAPKLWRATYNAVTGIRGMDRETDIEEQRAAYAYAITPVQARWRGEFLTYEEAEAITDMCDEWLQENAPDMNYGVLLDLQEARAKAKREAVATSMAAYKAKEERVEAEKNQKMRQRVEHCLCRHFEQWQTGPRPGQCPVTHLRSLLFQAGHNYDPHMTNDDLERVLAEMAGAATPLIWLDGCDVVRRMSEASGCFCGWQYCRYGQPHRDDRVAAQKALYGTAPPAEKKRRA